MKNVTLYQFILSFISVTQTKTKLRNAKKKKILKTNLKKNTTWKYLKIDFIFKKKNKKFFDNSQNWCSQSGKDAYSTVALLYYQSMN